MEQFIPLIEAIVFIMVLGSSAVIVETVICILKSFKQ